LGLLRKIKVADDCSAPWGDDVPAIEHTNWKPEADSAEVSAAVEQADSP
jgi:hypothetical protein